MMTIKLIKSKRKNVASVITPGTREEIQEEYDFIDACMETKVFETAKNFMVEKGKHYQVSL